MDLNKVPKMPFPIRGYYPSKFQQWRLDTYNAIFNHLYPIRPWLFTATFAASNIYFRRRLISENSSWILQLLTNVPILRTISINAHIAIASLVASYLPVLALRTFFRNFLFRYKGYLYDSPKRPSLKTKIWAICWRIVQKLAPPRLETCNALLPRLPVPKLEDTVRLYVESMEPILPKNEFEALREVAARFLQKEGKKLQFYTQFYSWFTSNYVTSFWERYVYLSGRDTLLINSSVGNIDVSRPATVSQAERSAHMAYLTAINMLAFNEHSVCPPADGLVYTGHYKRLFANTRIPGKYCDQWQSNRYSRHLAVYSGGCFYKVDVFDPITNRLYTVDELNKIFSDILHRSEKATEYETKIAALTHDRRDTWHENRRRFFLNHSENSNALKIIEDAIAFYILDDREYIFNPKKPQLMDFYSSEMLAGNGMNRWVDKVLNFVISRNGRIGGTCEHSVADGAEFAHIFENCLHIDQHFLKYRSIKGELPCSAFSNDLRARNGATIQHANTQQPLRNHAKSSCVNGSSNIQFSTTEISSEKLCSDNNSNLSPNNNIKLAERIHFDILPAMEAEIERCYNEYIPFKNDLDMATLVFEEYGKAHIKSGRCTPDAFMQMALQLANYKDQGRFVLTYEATSARFYQNSRTETLRTVSKESCAFVKAMVNSSSNDVERLRLLRQACSSHYMRNRKAMTGEGIDRHLFVLYVMSRATNTSSPFLQHYVSQKWLLSTSQPPCMTSQLQEDLNNDWAWLGANFGAVANNGYGVCYRFPGDHKIVAHISSYKSANNTSSSRFRSLLHESFREMSNLFNIERAAA